MVTGKLPLVKEVYIKPDAVGIYNRFRNLPFSFLLESSMQVKEIGRYSLIGGSPFLVLSYKDGILQVITENKQEIFYGNPLDKLKEILSCYHLQHDKNLPFCGGAVGYFSYDLGRLLEKLPATAVDDLNVPDFCLGFYDSAVIIDHLLGKVYISTTGRPEEEEDNALRRARDRLKELESLLYCPPVEAAAEKLVTGAKIKPTTKGKTALAIDSGRKLIPENFTGGKKEIALAANFSREEYCEIVERAREYILAGDIFEVNLSQRFNARLPASPWQIYKKLRLVNPSPFACFLDHEDLQIMGASPELFLKVRGRIVETRPIKGTRPRGSNPASDARLRRELWESEKDRAELVMIVDLERNDLGKVCKTGSVSVPELFRLEEYATVYHLVSTVKGELLAGKDITDLLKASFPGGSITGAPKVRAMEIIEELEPVRRGIYTGSVGYIDFNGNAQLNIVIRTMIVRKGQVYFQVGGAVTADSKPEAEYLETLAKGRAMVKALGLSKGGVLHGFNDLC